MPVLVVITSYNTSLLDFIIKDLPSVLIFIIPDQIVHESLRCSCKYNCYLCRFIDKLYSPLLTILINLSEICIIVKYV